MKRKFPFLILTLSFDKLEQCIRFQMCQNWRRLKFKDPPKSNQYVYHRSY